MAVPDETQESIMGFLDNLKGAVQDRLHPQDGQDGYYDDDYDDYDDSVSEARSRVERARDDRPSSGLLGNPSRPEANSVSVYTRSGRHLSNDDLTPASSTLRGEDFGYDDDYGYRDAGGYRDDGAYRTADDSWRASADHVVDLDPSPAAGTGSYVPAMTQPGVFGATGNTPADLGLTAVPRVSSGKLPPYVLKPASYDDVQMVIRRVRTNQPVVLSFKNLKVETAKRVLDFCFGLACGVDGAVEELGDRVFVVLPHGIELSDADLAKLRKDGLFR